LLEEQVQRREESRPFLGVQDVTADTFQHSVAIARPLLPVAPSRNDYSEARGGAPEIAGFGVFVSANHVLTHSTALNGRSFIEILTGDDRAIGARVMAYEPATGLVLLQVESGQRRTSPALATDTPRSGALAVAVGRARKREFVVPVFITSVENDEYTIGALNNGLWPGMPVFALSGELLAIAAPDGERVRAIPARKAAERMLARASTGDRRSSFGLGFQEPAGPLTNTFGKEGVVITEVLPGGPADMAGAEVGDVLLAVSDVSIDSSETAARALTTAAVGATTTLRVRRNSRLSVIEATPMFAYETVALARARPQVTEGPEAQVLFPPEVLEASGIMPSARVMSVNGRTMTSRVEVQRLLKGARQPVAVLVRHGDDQFFAAVEPVP
jgi:S1-C subfamily serine protease